MSQSINPKDIIPDRNPNLITRVARAFFDRQPNGGPQVDEQQTTASGVVTEAQQLIYDRYFSSKNDRITIYNDVDQLDQVSEEVSVALDTIADNAATSEEGVETSFIIDSDDADIQASLEAVALRCDLHQKIFTIARSSLKYGDVFLEVVVNKKKDVVETKLLPPITMYRNEDARANLRLAEPKYDKDGSCLNDIGECAFEQQDPDTNQIQAAFYPWQIVHGRWAHDGFSTYGRSMLRVTRIIAKKLRAEEESLIMGRLVRAMLKLVFYIDTTGLTGQQKKAAIEDFKKSILTRSTIDGRRENPYYVLTDFFVSDGHYRVGGEVRQSRTRIETLDPKNEGLNQIDDIKYFHRKKLATLRVPPAYMGFEEDVNAKATLSMQDIQYVRYVRRIQQYLSQLLKDIFSIQLILEGKDPANIDYSITWPSLQREDEAAASLTMLQQAQAAAILLGDTRTSAIPVVDAEYVMREVLEMNDAEVKKLLKRLEKTAGDQLDAKVEETGKLTKAKADNTPKPPPPVAPPPPANPPVVVDAKGKPVPVNGKQPAANGKEPAAKPTGQQPVRQEIALLAERIKSTVDRELSPDITRLFVEQKATLERTRELHDELQGDNNGRDK